MYLSHLYLTELTRKMPERRKKRDGGKKIVEVIEPKFEPSIHPRPSGRESEAKMITANEVEK